MAELPELETLRRELEKESVGKRFKVPEVVGAKVTKRNGNKKVFQGRLEGAKVKSVDRRGPYLSANLDNGELLLIDLGDKGYLEKVAPRSTAPKGTARHARLHPGRADPPGRHRAAPPRRSSRPSTTWPRRRPSWPRIGLDPVADPVSWTSFARVLLGKNVKLKTLLMDGEVVAGIGPIYSDEILWEAGLRHDRVSSELSQPGDPPSVPGARRDAPRGGEAPRLHASTTIPSSTSTASPATTRTSSRCTAGRASLPPLPGAGRQDPLRQQAALLLRGLPGLSVGVRALRGCAVAVRVRAH